MYVRSKLILSVDFLRVELSDQDGDDKSQWIFDLLRLAACTVPHAYTLLRFCLHVLQ